jgi:hypothetical protein
MTSTLNYTAAGIAQDLRVTRHSSFGGAEEI